MKAKKDPKRKTSRSYKDRDIFCNGMTKKAPGYLPGLSFFTAMMKKITLFLFFVFLLQVKDVFAYTEKEYLQLAKIAYENEFYDVSLNYLSQFDNLYPQSELKPYRLVIEGLDLRKLNRLAEAKKAFTTILSEYPQSTYIGQAYYLRGETNLFLNAFPEAEDDFRNALKRDLSEEMAPAAYQGLLISQANQGKFFEALSGLAEWEGKYPGVSSLENRKTLLGAAERNIAAALKERDYAKVHTIAGIILGNFPTGPSLDRISYYQASAFWQEGNLETARKGFLALRSSPDPEIAALANFRLGDISLSLKNYSETVPYYRQAEENSADAEIKAAARFQLGTIARKNQDYAGASDYFQKALGGSTQPAMQEKALFELAGTAFLSGDYQKSVSLYRDFQNRFPQSESGASALLQEAFALYNLKRYAEAKTAFQNFTGKYPDDNLAGQAYYGLGLVFISLGEKPRAAALWEHYLTEKPFVSGQAPMVLFLARFLIEENKQAEAVSYLKRLTSAPDGDDDTRTEAFLLLGLAYLKNSKVNESLAAFDSGLALKPRQELKDVLFKNKADLLLAKGDYRNAFPLYQQLQQTLPDKRGEVLYGMALSLQGLGRTQEAVPVYMEALMNLPANSPLAKEIKAALAQIKKK